MSIRMKSLLEVIIAYIFLVILLFANIYIYRQHRENISEIKKIKEKITNYTKKIKRLNNQVSALKKESNKFTQKELALKKRKRELEKTLLTQNDYARLLEDIQHICSKNKIEIINLTQLIGETEKNFSKTYFNLSINGSYENIVNFLGECESLPYILLISKFKIVDIEKETLTLKVDMEISVLLREVTS